MKTLKAFWHWVDNERPAHLDADSFRHLSDVADQALDIASDVIGERIGRPHVTVDQLREHWPAVRDLSLLICSGLEVMHEDVPEGDMGDITVKRRAGYQCDAPVILSKDAPAFDPFACPA